MDVAFTATIYLDLTGPLMWFLAAWFTALGAGIGSFMNVVVYRAPAGMSVVHPGSRCPKCRTPIRWYDNIPVISWLVLRGRCRSCGVWISTRYPLVEALVAAVFFTVAAVELFSGGANLPGVDAGPRWVPLSLLAVYLCQMLALCALICAALIEYDGKRMPKWMLIYAIVPLALASPWLQSLPPLPIAGFRTDWAAGLAGAGTGVLLGLIARLRFHGVQRRSTPELELMIIGIVAGWQMVTLLACVAVAVDLVMALVCWARGEMASPSGGVRARDGAGRLNSCEFSYLRIPWNAVLAMGLLLVIVFFRQVSDLLVVNRWNEPVMLLIASIFVAVVSCGTAWLDRRALAEKEGESPVSTDPDKNLNAILNSPSYRIAAYDTEFLQRQELRPVRLQLELLKPEMTFMEEKVHSTIVAFGGTQIVEPSEAQRRLDEARARLEQMPADTYRQREVWRAERGLANAKYYDAAREFGRLVSAKCQTEGDCDYVIVTGGGPGIMEAANRGASDVGAKSIGLNITLPAEQRPNPYITPELCFQFHYFAIRKMHFLLRAKALVVFPGGFGTLDELFDALTLRQTQRMQEIPIVLFGREYWDRVIDFQFLADEGVIADAHLNLIDYAETAEQAWDIIWRFHENLRQMKSGDEL